LVGSSTQLRAAPGSLLMAHIRRNKRCGLTVPCAHAHGISADRLMLGFDSPPWDVMRNVDITLDCFPHNSGTTLIESLFMGVSFVFLAGRSSVGRLGEAVASAIGHPEWIARTEDKYVDKVAGLASGIAHLETLRTALRGEIEACPLMDESTFARPVEEDYRTMWTQWCAQKV
jgi:protein O-GlcNAc transferase